jgi:hypothetical protein
MKRAKLLENLKSVVEDIPKRDLPANISAIYAFGGILREKSRLRDFDLLFLYSMTEDQIVRWNRFRENFSTYGISSNHDKHPLIELESLFEPFRKKNMSLHEAVKNEKLALFLAQKGIPPSWAGCFSWTEVYRGYHGDGIFYPDLDRVLRRILVGRQFKGLQLQIQSYEDFEKKFMSLVAKNYVLAWSLERPDIEENIEGRPEQEKIDYAAKELDFFVKEQIPRFRNGSEYGGGYEQAKDSAAKASVGTGLRINLEALEKQHVDIRHTSTESYDELLRKCETARNEMRNYHKETVVLNQIASALENWERLKKEGYVERIRLEDQIAQQVIQWVEKAVVKEDEVRQILRTMDLPEHNVITIKAYGYTWYKVPENNRDKETLLKEARLQKIRREYLMKINKVIKPLESDAQVDIGLTDGGKPRWLVMRIWKQIEEEDEALRKSVTDDLIARRFNVKTWTWAIEGTKQSLLTGEENLKQLQEIAKQMLKT